MIAGIDPVAERARREPRPARRQRHGIHFEAAGAHRQGPELLREAVPALPRVLVDLESGQSGRRNPLKETQAAAHTLGVRLESVEVRGGRASTAPPRDAAASAGGRPDDRRHRDGSAPADPRGVRA